MVGTRVGEEPREPAAPAGRETLPAMFRGPRVTAAKDWVTTFWPALVAFVASRLVLIGCLYVAPAINSTYSRRRFFTDYDGAHYLSVAQTGYPPLYPKGGGFNALSAFFPLLPLLIRGLHAVTGIGYKVSGILIVNAALLASFCVIWLLVRETTSAGTASRAVFLTAFWPASFVLSMIYSDSLLLLLSAGCLLALRKRHWITAGATALLASAARPNGLVLALCCLWAAVAEWRRNGALRPFVSVLLAPLGALAYFLYLWEALGSPTTWFTAEHKGWGQGFDFGHRWASDILVALHHPTARMDLMANSFAGIVGIALLAWVLRERLPATLTIYAAGVLLLAVCSGFGGSQPRFVLDAFPLFIPPAMRLRATWLHAAVALLAGGLVLFFFVVELRGAVP